LTRSLLNLASQADQGVRHQGQTMMRVNVLPLRSSAITTEAGLNERLPAPPVRPYFSLTSAHGLGGTILGLSIPVDPRPVNSCNSWQVGKWVRVQGTPNWPGLFSCISRSLLFRKT
jgi:hypothetical protein